MVEAASAAAGVLVLLGPPSRMVRLVVEKFEAFGAQLKKVRALGNPIETGTRGCSQIIRGGRAQRIHTEMHKNASLYASRALPICMPIWAA